MDGILPESEQHLCSVLRHLESIEVAFQTFIDTDLDGQLIRAAKL